MKNLVVFAILFVAVVAGYAQSIDNFVVGPYEVDYRGEGDFKYRIRKGVDLYEYFGLKKDSINSEALNEHQPVKHGVQINAFMSLPRFATGGNSNIFGLSGSWKQQIENAIYLNAGLSFGFSYGKYDYDESGKSYHRNENMIEVGVPLSVEFARLDYKKASVYAGIGLSPTYYNTIKADETTSDGLDKEGDKESGFLIVPRIDFGGYIPLNNRILRIGVYGEYKINCSGDVDIYEKRISRAFVGANVGLVF